MKRLFYALALAGLPVAALADVSLQLQIDKIYGADGVTAVPAGMTYVLVASTLNATFGTVLANSGLALGSTLGDSDDYIVYRGSTGSNGHTSANPNPSIKYSDYPNLNANDPLELVWFPTVNSSASTVPQNAAYGKYTDPTGIDGSSPWVAPTDNTNGTPLAFYTQDGGFYHQGTNPHSSGVASFTAVPEPGSAGLVLAGLAWMGMRRRRAVA